MVGILTTGMAIIASSGIRSRKGGKHSETLSQENLNSIWKQAEWK
jgi:hypothetical protein